MLKEFIAHIQQQHLFPTGQQVLLAVSGGIDSVVLTHLMHSAGYPFAIAHCNFHLRPSECDRDETFVRQLASSYGVPIHVAQFDTMSHATNSHQSIEQAARQLRYEYFEQLRCKYSYAAIITAHHRDDSNETLFLNLLRGTGLSGLHGILPIQGHIVRPLLPFSRTEIVAYASQQHLPHVEDSTNASLDYLRNQVRHQLMPLLRQLQPAADRTIQQTVSHLQSVEQLYQTLINPLRQQLVQFQPDNTIRISLCNPLPAPLHHTNSPQLRQQLYYEILKPYSFNASTVANILAATQPGKTFYSSTHTAYLNRGYLLICPTQNHPTAIPSLIISTISPQGFDPKQLPPYRAAFDADTITLPLHLRHWKPGDRFQPLGMAHGTQLISDYFSDHHYSQPEKQSQLILVDATDSILWIVGRRTSHPHRITSETSHIITAEII
ncbi:MAG: tRNA lysidine(34) synthetase TilS [Bacteroidales bacterium]|nr:tRNA lysidine(34) synthetase TilS [Bacteroidales bacterium]